MTKQRIASMPNFAPARHAEIIKIRHMQTDSADYGPFRTVQANRAVQFEQTHFHEIRYLKYLLV